MFDKKYYIFDGGLGTMLQENGLEAGACPEEMNVNNPEAVYKVHKLYADKGADFLSTNSFGGNRYKLEEYGLGDKVKEFNVKAAQIAKKAAGDSGFAAGSVGPTGRFLQPLGDMHFDEAYEVYKEQIEALVEGGADCIIFETFNDLGELKAGVIAAKDVTDIPIIVSLTYEKQKTLTGVSPESAAIVMEALGVYAIGANCSGGPKELFEVLKKYREVTNLPLLVQPNAGMPELRNGQVYFPLKPEQFMEEMDPYFTLGGIKFFGSCCVSNPEHTAAYKKILPGKFIEGKRMEDSSRALASKSRFVFIGENHLPKLIGERINPTARKKLAESIRNNDLSLVQEDAYNQTEKGAHLLDVNLGMADIDQKEKMKEVINLIQQSIDTPLVVDSTDPGVIEEALKFYQGKALINSVNGEKESMDKILPLAKRYGASVIALALDEDGIPESKEGRLAVAERIMKKALSLGISKKDIFVDCLVLTMGTSDLAARETLDTIKLVKEKLGLSVVLGVSNVSHGLPERGKINAAFLAVAIYNGLDLGIVNPENKEIMNSWEAASLIAGRDPHAGHYLERNSLQKAVLEDKTENEIISFETVTQMVVRGSKNIIAPVSKLIEEKKSPVDIINKGLIPGLNIVGEKFEKGEYYLPQLMLSAEVSQKAFDYLEGYMGEDGRFESKGTLVIGTVKGDVHDIGKNMVGVMVKNHGYKVIDLGKNVSREMFMEAVEKYSPDFVGLSALMTTTMTEIPGTIKYIKEKYPNQKFICGGAVVTEDYAVSSGADGFCRDAVHTISVMERLKEV